MAPLLQPDQSMMYPAFNNELALGTAIALSKRMNGIQTAQVPGSTLAELLLRQTVQKGLLGKPGKQLLKLLTEHGVGHENRVTLADIHLLGFTPLTRVVQLRFEIEDHGIGISTEQINQLFQPFQQADTSTSRRFGGTGLGLVISRQLVELMGGELGVNSTPGQGSTFWFTLPLALGTTEHAPTTPINPSTALELKGLRVLVAEDNPVNQILISSILEKLGVHVVLVNDGAHAVEWIQAHHEDADLVLMDCQMPVMDGYEASRQIRMWEQTHHSRHLPIIALTANAMAEDREESLRAGMDDHLTKPLNINELRDRLLIWCPVTPRRPGQE